MDPWGGTPNNSPVVEFLTFIFTSGCCKDEKKGGTETDSQKGKKVVQKITHNSPAYIYIYGDGPLCDPYFGVFDI